MGDRVKAWSPYSYQLNTDMDQISPEILAHLEETRRQASHSYIAPIHDAVMNSPEIKHDAVMEVIQVQDEVQALITHLKKKPGRPPKCP